MLGGFPGVAAWSLFLLTGSAGASSLRAREPLALAARAGGKPALFAAHHKTASAVLWKINIECLPAGAADVDDHWYPSKKIPSGQTVVHFIRDLGDLAVSAYLYHKNTGEKWSMRPGTAKEFCRKTGFPTTRHTKPRSGETYTEFLQRLPVEEGVKAELFRVRHGVTFEKVIDKGFDEIEAALDACEASPSCTTVCVEDETAKFNETWKGVFDAIDLDQDSVDWACMQNHSYEAIAKVKPEHITSYTTKERERAMLKTLAMRIDQDSMNSSLATLNQKNPCKHN